MFSYFVIDQYELYVVRTITSRRIMSRKIGPTISTLPNIEVLIRIFERSFVDTNKDYSSASLIRVCRLFRKLAFARGSLWNAVHLGPDGS